MIINLVDARHGHLGWDSQHHTDTSMGVNVSHETILTIADAVLDEVTDGSIANLGGFYP